MDTATITVLALVHFAGVLETVAILYVLWLFLPLKRKDGHPTEIPGTVGVSRLGTPKHSNTPTPASDAESRRRVHYLTPAHENAVTELASMQADPEDGGDLTDGLD